MELTVENSQEIDDAAHTIKEGGVIAYPTEGVFGLGCRPENQYAVKRINELKQRDPDKGLLLIAADINQLDKWICLPEETPDLASEVSKPITWVVPALNSALPWIRGAHDNIAIRVTRHPVARALCIAADSALVSTSANISGEEPVQTVDALSPHLLALVDYVLPGKCGSAGGPSEIRDLVSGQVMRPA